MAFQPSTHAEIDRAVKAWFAAAPPMATGLGSAETFAEIEQLAMRIGRSVARHLTEEALKEQAPDVGTEALCPQCGRTCRMTCHTRRLVTVAGEVSYAEPASHCETCRRDFFSGTGETPSR